MYKQTTRKLEAVSFGHGEGTLSYVAEGGKCACRNNHDGSWIVLPVFKLTNVKLLEFFSFNRLDTIFVSYFANDYFVGDGIDVIYSREEIEKKLNDLQSGHTVIEL